MVVESGTVGNDYLMGGAGTDYLLGGYGADSLFGGAGADYLSGEYGNDELVGGLGSDTLQGGPEADVFSFSGLFSGIDSIADFSLGDKIKVSTEGFLGASSTDQFSYDNSTGALFFDLSPLDEVRPTQFASLAPNLSSVFNPSNDILLGEDSSVSASDATVSLPAEPSLEPVSNEPSLEQGQVLPIGATVSFNGELIGLEVAQTSEQRALGLMHRDSLDSNRGMLFSFGMPRYTRFWMQNVVIPLDMIFLREGEIQAIYEAVPPCTASPCPTYGPQTPVDSAIELRGGRVAELGLQVGDRVDIQLLNTP